MGSMTKVSLEAAQADLAGLVERALDGEDIVIETNDSGIVLQVRIAAVAPAEFDEKVGAGAGLWCAQGADHAWSGIL